MPEITPYGYLFIRDRIETNWRYVEITDDEGEVITRISDNDYRFTINNEESTSSLKMTLELEGSNHDISIPCTIAKLALYLDDEEDDALAEVNIEPNIKMEQTGDEVVIEQYVEVPRITF